MAIEKGGLRHITPVDLDRERRASKWWSRKKSDGKAGIEQRQVNKICYELKEIRRTKHIDFTELAEALHVTVATLSSFELGWVDKKELQDFIVPWAKALGSTLEEIEKYLARVP